MDDGTKFILNVKDGSDVLHRVAGLTERCNTDQLADRQTVDDETAAALIATGQARACEHCKPDPA